MNNTIFVGNKITMEGINIEIPFSMDKYKREMEEVVYEVFYGAFHEKVDKKFLKTMRMNNVLYQFAEYHVKRFFDLHKDDASKMVINTKEYIESYFVDAIDNYKKRISEVSF